MRKLFIFTIFVYLLFATYIPQNSFTASADSLGSQSNPYPVYQGWQGAGYYYFPADNNYQAGYISNFCQLNSINRNINHSDLGAPYNQSQIAFCDGQNQQSTSTSNQNNNQQTSTPLSLTLDPSGSMTLSPGTQVQITATASGGNSAIYNIVANDVRGNQVASSQTNTLNFIYTVPTPPATNSIVYYPIYVTAYDASHNTAKQALWIQVNPSMSSSSSNNNQQTTSTPLSVSVTPSGTIYASPGSTVQITATASGGNSAGYDLFLYDTTGKIVAENQGSTLSYTYTVPTTAVTGQYYGFTVAAYDASGNVVTKIIYIDTTASSSSTSNQNNNQQTSTPLPPIVSATVTQDLAQQAAHQTIGNDISGLRYAISLRDPSAIKSAVDTLVRDLSQYLGILGADDVAVASDDIATGIVADNALLKLLRSDVSAPDNFGGEYPITDLPLG